MATRRLTTEDWKPVWPTKITIRRAPEPRDEQMRLPKGLQRMGTSPSNVFLGQQYPGVAVPTLQKPTEQYCEPPRDPEIVDVGDGNTWPRRTAFWKRQLSQKARSPTPTSRHSTGLSDKSFGILDYYLQASSPQPSPKPSLPEVPRIETPFIDPAMDRFDFDLMPSTLLHSDVLSTNNEESSIRTDFQDTVPGAESSPPPPPHHLLDSSPPPRLTASRNEHKDTYSLFPKTRVVTPTRKTTAENQALESLQVENAATAGTIRIVPSHQQPDASYRPRKESVSSSVRSRKDSFTSFSGTRRIPMRVLSSTSTSTPKTISTASNSTSTASPPQQSRWSDDTVTSPGVLTTPGPRTSFGSLLGGDGTRYPLCFFEDDDANLDGEVAPLRNKFRWQRSSKLRHKARTRKPGRFEDERMLGRRLVGVLLCTCCT